MCGLVGVASRDGRGLPPEELAELMRLLRHRGPDDEGMYRDSFVALGHTRLAIIDPAGGRQPMFSSDGRFVLIYNGEIYNYRELRKILAGKGYLFTTQSDTEVLLYWLIEHGTAGLATLKRHVCLRPLGPAGKAGLHGPGPAGHQAPLLSSGCSR